MEVQYELENMAVFEILCAAIDSITYKERFNNKDVALHQDGAGIWLRMVDSFEGPRSLTLQLNNLNQSQPTIKYTGAAKYTMDQNQADKSISFED